MNTSGGAFLDEPDDLVMRWPPVDTGGKGSRPGQGDEKSRVRLHPSAVRDECRCESRHACDAYLCNAHRCDRVRDRIFKEVSLQKPYMVLDPLGMPRK